MAKNEKKIAKNEKISSIIINENEKIDTLKFSKKKI